MEDRFMTLHPDPKKEGVSIDRGKYEQIKSAMLTALQQQGQLSFKELNNIVNRQLSGHFDGSISWYVTTVKLDLEARGDIVRIPGSKPQMLRIP